MLYTLAGSLPKHLYTGVESNALGKHGWLPAVWFGLVSYPGRTWGCHLLLECGAIYRNVPLHQLAFHPGKPWPPENAQTWDCYGLQFSTIEYPYLSGLGCRVRLGNGTEYEGHYLFTAVPIGDSFSSEPTQAKEFSFVMLDNGRYTAQPSDRVLFEDRSFTRDLEWPKFLKRQYQTWSAEEKDTGREH